jgi:hypothetical protein
MKELTLDASAAGLERPHVPLDGALTNELVADEIRVVRRGDVVFGEWAAHIIPDAIVCYYWGGGVCHFDSLVPVGYLGVSGRVVMLLVVVVVVGRQWRRFLAVNKSGVVC